MDNNTKQTIETKLDGSSKLDDKTSELSHKVWELQRNTKLININADGTIPIQINNSLENNKIYPTNYVFDDSGTMKRKTILKVEGKLYSLDATEVS